MNNLKNKNQKVVKTMKVEKTATFENYKSREEYDNAVKNISFDLMELIKIHDEDMKNYKATAGRFLKDNDITEVCKENKAFVETRKYIKQHIFKTEETYFTFYKDGIFKVYSAAEFKTYMGKTVNRGIMNWFDAQGEKYKFVTEPSKPIIYDNYLNNYKRMIHTYDKDKVFSKKTKAYGQVILDFIKEVLCSGNQDQYEWIEKWIGNICRGNKNDSALYLKSIQGVGKSTLAEYLIDNIIGDEASLLSGSEPLVTKFNSILRGRTLVCFEELETFDTKSWEAVSSKLKTMITTDKTTYESKNKDSSKERNISNYMIMTNNEAVKDSSGRRYFDLDISTHRQGDKEYFNTIYDKGTVWNKETGDYLFHYFHDKCPEGWKSQQNMPMTKSKLDNFAKLLHPVYAFLKTDYIDIDKDLKVVLRDLYNDYNNHEIEGPKRPISIQQFNTKLKEVGLICKRGTAGALTLNESVSKLREIAKVKNWYHELDDGYEKFNQHINQEDNKVVDDGINYKLAYLTLLKELDKFKEDNEKLLDENQKLKKQLDNAVVYMGDESSESESDPFIKEYDSEISSDEESDDESNNEIYQRYKSNMRRIKLLEK